MALQPDAAGNKVLVTATATAQGQTGVEMEALAAATFAAINLLASEQAGHVLRRSPFALAGCCLLGCAHAAELCCKCPSIKLRSIDRARRQERVNRLPAHLSPTSPSFAELGAQSGLHQGHTTRVQDWRQERHLHAGAGITGRQRQHHPQFLGLVITG